MKRSNLHRHQGYAKSFHMVIFRDLYKRGHLKRYINPNSKQDLNFISTKHIDESKIHEIENNPTEMKKFHENDHKAIDGARVVEPYLIHANYNISPINEK